MLEHNRFYVTGDLERLAREVIDSIRALSPDAEILLYHRIGYGAFLSSPLQADLVISDLRVHVPDFARCAAVIHIPYGKGDTFRAILENWAGNLNVARGILTELGTIGHVIWYGNDDIGIGLKDAYPAMVSLV